MALTTRCPQCGTSFKVVPDQLRVRNGLVRCGACSTVFDGRACLLPESGAPTTLPPAPVAQPATQPAAAAAAPVLATRAAPPAPPAYVPPAYVPPAPARPVDVPEPPRYV
ncbi:MJ0042-type zinc finger domain-containing protein, partial [Achromobacter kerstersii]|uniref:MJ0042-type zinc finger domain-containing protein n=1 Tax=Achromobacter kerstersii TaxID=1353890 RepID=UPI00320A567B